MKKQFAYYAMSSLPLRRFWNTICADMAAGIEETRIPDADLDRRSGSCGGDRCIDILKRDEYAAD